MRRPDRVKIYPDVDEKLFPRNRPDSDGDNLKMGLKQDRFWLIVESIWIKSRYTFKTPVVYIQGVRAATSFGFSTKSNVESGELH